MSDGTVQDVFDDNPSRLVLSGGEQGARETLRRFAQGYQSERIVSNQAFHRNFSTAEAVQYVTGLLGTAYRQLNAWGEKYEYNLKVAKRGRLMFSRKLRKEGGGQSAALEHNRVKKYLLPEGEIVPPLVDIGVFTPEGAVVPAKYDKYKQINRFLELINDTLGDEVPGRPLHIVDFGCGKSYLTFIMYHFLAKVKKLAVEVTGVDLKADVIAHCQATADKYGYDNLHFVAGSIEGFQAGGTVDVVVSLHACDTATDYALFNAVSWKARHIFSVPCCQHELNKQMQGGNFPILMRHGIVQERFAALATDAIRANLLTAVGYRTQLMEFVDLAHTPKNLLIRATRANIPAEKRLEAWREVQALISEYRFQPKLVELLSDELTEI